jgi:hypothetical protein
MALTLDGTAGITFPVTAGSASAVQASSGRVLQVVQGTKTNSTSTSAYNTWVSTGLSASITPSNSTSKILATISGQGWPQAVNVQGVFTLYRNSTNLSPSTYGFTQLYSGGAGFQSAVTFSYLDSPTTTSSTTYTLYFTVTNAAGTVVFNSDNAWGFPTATILLQEIAA